MEQNPDDSIPCAELNPPGSSKTKPQDAMQLEAREERAKYFATIATEEMDKLWDEKGWNNATMQEWLNSDS